MAALHTALQALSPTDFASVPSSPDELDVYLSGIFEQTQLILDSLPIPSADDGALPRPRSNAPASSAFEMVTSPARSEPPPPDRAALQKEWGKPMKLGQKENPLGISVYKASGKDGKGAWFARRSVHEGLGFSRFQKAFETEFPASLAVQGAPGEGNIRGIGAETRVADVTASHQAKMQVYRLSAQFPGPTTPRDFVTLLLTSPKALTPHKEGELVPRHFMIVSKPCDHPDTQPRNGFIRGQYESVEFIREIPRRLKTSTSTTDLSQLSHKHGHNLEQDVLIHNAEKYAHLHPGERETPSTSRDASPMGRKRSHTVADPTLHSSGRSSIDEYDPEENPVEWIMVTRSDPGGSVPRFMVERGTPGSICADAVKFLDWACQLDDTAIESPATPTKPPTAFRRESFTSFASREQFPDIDDSSEEPQHLNPSIPQTTLTEATPNTPNAPNPTSGLWNSVAGTFSSYAPQAVLNHLPGGTSVQTSNSQTISHDARNDPAEDEDDDASSTISTTSFASADSHLSCEISPDSPTASMLSQSSVTNKPQTAHEKELAKLSKRRATLEAKHAATKAKLESQTTTATAKEAAALKKAEEKHEKGLKKQEERYRRELEKIEQRKKREERKAEERKKRTNDKDEKEKLRRERDELKDKVEVLEREAEVWMRQVGELQKENTRLMARVGRLETGRDAMSTKSDDASGNNFERQASSSPGPDDKKLSRSNTPTPGTGYGNSLAAAGIGGVEKRNPSEENLKRLSSRVRTLTLNSLGIGDRAGGEGEVATSGNRSRSSSLFRKRKQEGAGSGNGALAASEGGNEKGSMRSEGSAAS